MATPLTRKPKVVALRRRHRSIDATASVVEGMREHRVPQNSALISHFGFLSIFPLMIVATTVVGFVLQNRPAWRDDLIGSAADRIPIIGPQIASRPETLHGNWFVFAIGLLAALWSATKAFLALQTALDDVDEVPIDDRANAASGRLRAVGAIALIGVSQVVSVMLATLTGVVEWHGVGEAALFLAAVGVNTVTAATAYRWMGTTRHPWRRGLPGALVAGVIFTGLQVLGTTIVQRAIANASEVYGTFATVVALMSWISLHAITLLVGAEINRVAAGYAQLRARPRA